MTAVGVELADIEYEMYTIEGDHSLCNVTVLLLEKTRVGQIELICVDLDMTLISKLERMDIINLDFLDENNTSDASTSQYKILKQERSEKSIFVIDDIHWSLGMERFWNVVKEDPEVTCAIDIYGMGLLFFNPDLPKQSYIVAFQI